VDRGTNRQETAEFRAPFRSGVRAGRPPTLHLNRGKTHPADRIIAADLIILMRAIATVDTNLSLRAESEGASAPAANVFNAPGNPRILRTRGLHRLTMLSVQNLLAIGTITFYCHVRINPLTSC
jgi:hypothetical protein